jgi:hypothetical protein
MRVSVLTGYALSAGIAVATFAGCGAQPPIDAPGAMPYAKAAATHAERGRSWMLPEAKKVKRLLYLSDSGPDVFVYDYDSFEKVGELTGLDGALQECVDARGDVWIVQDTSGSQGGANAVEYPHGGTTMAGYDNKGNLYVTALAQNKESLGICELPAGGKALIPVAVGKSITSPTGIMWDGKYMAITNDDGYVAMIFQAEERRNGKALRVVGRTTLADSCFGDEVNISPPPFILGKKNTPVNTTQGTAVAGFNFDCGINPSHFRLWAYPGGGSPLREIAIPDGGGEAVSIAP